MMHLKVALAAMVLAGMPVHARAQAQDQSAAATAAPIDPARLAAARQIAAAILPDGTYARVMNGTLSHMLMPMIDGMYALPVSELAGIGGAKADDLKKLGKTTTAQIMAILDPHFHERTQRTMDAMFAGITALVVTYEPAIREGLAEAYARRFDLAQLAELNRFFATPTGHAYAAQTMIISTDPAVMSRMQDMMPAMIKQMPAIMQNAQAATANLPPPRKFDQLSPAERSDLEKLLGVSGNAQTQPAR